MAMFAQQRKGGSSRARAARARKGHQRRMGRNRFAGSGYKGHGSHRTKRSWMF